MIVARRKTLPRRSLWVPGSGFKPGNRLFSIGCLLYSKVRIAYNEPDTRLLLTLQDEYNLGDPLCLPTPDRANHLSELLDRAWRPRSMMLSQKMAQFVSQDD